MKYARLIGTGGYLPEKVLTNADLEKMVHTTDQWIRERTGIRQRHIAAEGETTCDLAEQAARRAIAAAEVGFDEVDLIIVATTTPDQVFPSTACLLQHRLGIRGCAAFDVQAVCTGFIYALAIADKFIRTGSATTALVVGAETFSRIINWKDRKTCVLFGDGAGAVVLEPNDNGDGRGVLSTHLYSDGNFASLLWMEKPSPKDRPTFRKDFFDEGRFFPKMDGRNVFVNACQRMPEAVRAGLEANGLTIEDVDHLIPHQANDRISLMVAKGLRIPVEKVIRNIDRIGNTTAASIPIALDEAVKAGRVKRGDLVALTSFGSGFTWASALLRW